MSGGSETADEKRSLCLAAYHLETVLSGQQITELALVVASSLGADLACAFLAQTKLPVCHVFFDGGQFARIGKATRHIMVQFLYLVIKSLYHSKGRTLKKLMWCGDAAVFIGVTNIKKARISV